MTVLSQIPFVRIPQGLTAELLADLIPRWSAYLKAFDECRRQRSQLDETAAAIRDAGNPIVQIAGQLLEGQPFSDTFVDDIVRADHNLTSLGHAGRTVDVVERHLISQLDEDVRHAADRMLSDLDSRLQQVVTSARQIDLGTAWSAEDAVNQRRLTEWAEFAEFDKEHSRIRGAQTQIMQGLSLSGIEHLATFGYFREYAAAFPDWYYWRADGQPVVTTHDDVTERIYARPPWPDGPDRFRWLVDHPEVEVWIPSPAQILSTVRAAHQARRRPSPAELRADAKRINRDSGQRAQNSLVG